MAPPEDARCVPEVDFAAPPTAYREPGTRAKWPEIEPMIFEAEFRALFAGLRNKSIRKARHSDAVGYKAVRDGESFDALRRKPPTSRSRTPHARLGRRGPIRYAYGDPRQHEPIRSWKMA